MDIGQKIAPLNLSNNEIKVFECLKEYPESNIARIQRGVKIPRMTVYLTVSSLKKRGLIDFHRRGKRDYWYVLPNHILISEIMDMTKTLIEGNPATKNDVSGTLPHFAVHTGADTIIQLYIKKFQNEHKNRLYIIQPFSSLTALIQKTKRPELIIELNEIIKNNEIIVEGIFEQATPARYHGLLHKSKKFSGHEVEQVYTAIEARVNETIHVSDEILKNIPVEILVLKDVIIVTSFEEGWALEITHKSVADALRGIIQLLKILGEKVDQAELARKLIQK